MRWIVTREDEDGRAECARLREKGLEAVQLPCLETAWHPWPWEDAGRLTLFTSRRTVEAWARAGRPPLGRAAALLPGTARALEREGVTAEVTAAGGARALAERAAAYWRSSGDASRGFIRYPTSHAGLASPEQAEAVAHLERVAAVDRRVVYDVRPPAGLAGRAAALAQGSWGVSLSSPSAVASFLDAAAGAPPPRGCWCMGESTARAWDRQRPAGWPPARAFTDIAAALEECT